MGCSATSQLASETPTAGARASAAATTPSEAAAASASQEYRPGQTAIIQAEGSDYAKITISKPSFHASYTGAVGTDKPTTPGDVYVQAWVTYLALSSGGIDYNFVDWKTYADSADVTDLAVIFNGPQPTYKSGHLPSGRSVSFWIFNEVPAQGEVLLSYAPPQFSTGGSPIAEWKVR